MSERTWLALLLFLGLLLVWIWSLCMAIKQDQEEAKRDALSADPTCDIFNLRGSGREGRDT